METINWLWGGTSPVCGDRLPIRSAALLFAIAFCGCSPDESNLADVQGRVTLDGTPVKGAVVEFIPASGQGSVAYGLADADGHYEMRFTTSSDGALVGMNTVRISTGGPATWNGKVYNDMPENSKELFPHRYNHRSDLQRNVQPGKNTFDFECTSSR